jgi:hypothetical protein
LLTLSDTLSGDILQTDVHLVCRRLLAMVTQNCVMTMINLTNAEHEDWKQKKTNTRLKILIPSQHWPWPWLRATSWKCERGTVPHILRVDTRASRLLPVASHSPTSATPGYVNAVYLGQWTLPNLTFVRSSTWSAYEAGVTLGQNNIVELYFKSSKPSLNGGSVVAQAISCRLRSGHVGFVVDKAALGQVFPEYFRFLCH